MGRPSKLTKFTVKQGDCYKYRGRFRCLFTTPKGKVLVRTADRLAIHVDMVFAEADGIMQIRPVDGFTIQSDGKKGYRTIIALPKGQ